MPPPANLAVLSSLYKCILRLLESSVACISLSTSFRIDLLLITAAVSAEGYCLLSKVCASRYKHICAEKKETND